MSPALLLHAIHLLPDYDPSWSADTQAAWLRCFAALLAFVKALPPAFTDAHVDQVRRMKDHFPFRIVFGAFDDAGKFYVRAARNRGPLNRARTLGPVLLAR